MPPPTVEEIAEVELRVPAFLKKFLHDDIEKRETHPYINEEKAVPFKTTKRRGSSIADKHGVRVKDFVAVGDNVDRGLR